MSVAVWDYTSWDHLIQTDLEDLPNWTGAVTSIVGGYNGEGQAIRGPSDYYCEFTAGTYDTVIARVRFRPTSLPADRDILSVRTGSTDHVSLQVNSSGMLKITLGVGLGGPYTSTGHDALEVDAWYDLELAAYIHNSDGAFAVKLDGIEVSDLSVSGVDTWVGTTKANLVNLDNANGDFDDFYALVGNGGFEVSDMLSDTNRNPKIATLHPTGTGDYAQWGNASAAHFFEIDEAQADGDTTYLMRDSTTGTGNYEAWYMQPLPSLARTIHRLDTVYQVRCEVSGEQVQHFLRIGDTDYAHPDAPSNLPGGAGNYTFEQKSWTTNPATEAAWSADAINALQAGISRYTSLNTDGTIISQAVLSVLYAETNLTITITPSFPILAWISRRAVVTDESTGYVQRRQVQSSVSRQSGRQSVRSWQITWNWLTPTEKDAILAVYDAAMGRAFSMYIEPGPGLGLIECHFTEDSMRFDNVSGQWWRTTAMVEEVI